MPARRQLHRAPALALTVVLLVLAPAAAALLAPPEAARLVADADAAACAAADAAAAAAPCEAWRATAGGEGDDAFRAVAASPDGATLYLAGESWGGRYLGFDYLTLAVDAATGDERWRAAYRGSANAYDYAKDVAATPDGALVIITGTSNAGGMGNNDFATAAYDAASGALRWSARYDGPLRYHDDAVGLALSPDGARVYVAGSSYGDSTGLDYAAVAYDARTGDRLWESRYNCMHATHDRATALALDPTGARLYVTGATVCGGAMTGTDFITLALDAATGRIVWESRYAGPGGWADDPTAIAVAPDGRVVVTGASYGNARTGFDYATVALAPEDGAVIWTARHDGPAHGHERATALAVAGDRVFVTGRSPGPTSQDVATAAYDAATGDPLWTARHDAGAHDEPHALVVAPDGASLLVAGATQTPDGPRKATLLALDPATGALRWSTQAPTPEPADGAFTTLLPTRDGRVHAAGWLPGRGSARDAAAVAYQAPLMASLGIP